MLSQSFSVIGMSCSACADHVRQALKSVEGVQQAWAEYPASVAGVEFDPEITNVEHLVSVVEEEGYRLTPAPAAAK